jgi:histidinol-phosphate aminotransferase
MMFTAPSPRRPVADPALVRPDWTKGVLRDAHKLWIDKNENFDPDLLALTTRVLRSIDPVHLCTYPELTPFYEKLAKHLGIRPAELLITAGSDGAIRMVFEAFVNEGDLVLHTAPTFAMYPVYCQMYGAKAVPVAYEASSSGPSISADRLMAAIAEHRPKLVCLPNPDSPTGTVFVPADLERIIVAAGEAGAAILIDEAYFPFYPHTVLPLVQKYGHLLVARTFAKAWGLAGLRIGCLAACEDVARIVHRVRPMYEVNTVAVAVMDLMLDHEAEVMAGVARLNDSKAAFLDAMAAMGLRVLRGQGNFLHVAFGDHAAAVHAALTPLALYRKDFNEPCLKGFSRFSVAPRPVMQPVVDAIRRVVAPVGAKS